MTRRGLLLLPLLALIACGAKGPTAPQSDWIELNSLTPSNGTTLTAGERTTFTATVTCTIVRSDGGFVELRLSDQGGRRLVASGESQSVQLRQGAATVTLSGTVTTPASGGIVYLALPMFINGSHVTAAAKTASYPVR